MNLFTPFRLRGIELKNRIVVSPMCEYSANDGHPTNWHLVHLGSRAVGGAALVFTEATAVSAIGRISSADTGIYLDSHIEAWRPIVEFIQEQGAVAGIQLAHAGRKASTATPWLGGAPVGIKDGGWTPVAPSAIPFDKGYTEPKELTLIDIDRVVEDFAAAAHRALKAGFQVVEIHAAHGYLLHQFLSPLSNHRRDEYGENFDNRIRLLLRVAKCVREIWPEQQPVFVRISATDWKENGWDLEQSIELSRRLKQLGMDLVDVSSGGAVPGVRIPVGPGYQVGFASAIRREAGIATGAVGMISEPAQAETIISSGQADIVLLAREMLRDPYWPRRAAHTLGVKIKPPVQYERAW
ncbi:MAG TPA: NADH:flavin oxidoreductase/NADH oxidase [Candidatus Acidoferrum sp.]|nr:NADH:flavin oxidoreductase/NADH oxidase [Candidatus Acidoferrum sp.]